MNRAIKKVSAMFLSVMLALTSVPSAFAATVDSGSETSYSVQNKAKTIAKAPVSGGDSYAAVLRADKVANDAQTKTLNGYSQQVETKLSEATGDLSATYFEQDKYLSDPTGEKNGQSTYNVTLENAYVGPQIQQTAPDGQDIIIIEDASASMNGRVRYENEGVKSFLTQMQKTNAQRIQNAVDGKYADYNPEGKTRADAEAWLKTNGKLLRLVGVESFNYTTYTKWRQSGGSYVLSDSEVSSIASASALKDGYPGGEDLMDLTATDKALQNVRGWISDAKKTSVVLLTDGEPYGAYSNDDLSCGNTELIMFNSTTANNAISIAKSMKAQGTSIYTSFMFYERDWDNIYLRNALKSENIDDLKMPPYVNISAITMSLISSDYPGGGHLGTVSGGTGLNWTFTVDKTNANGFGTYMKLTQNEDAIAAAIGSVAGQINTNSIASALQESRYASVSSYILDDISYPFELNGDINDIKVYQVPRVPKNLDATGHPADASNVTAFTWGDKEDITNEVSVSYENNRIVISGYNYEDHALTTFDHDLVKDASLQGSDPNKYNTGDYGYKLVVEFPICAKQSFGGNDIETNDSTTSGFYPSKPGSEAIAEYPKWENNSSMNPNGNHYVALYPVPMVDLKVNYAIVGSDQTIYAPQTAELLNMLTDDTTGNNPLTIFNIGETAADRKAYNSARLAYTKAKDNCDDAQKTYEKAYKAYAASPNDKTLIQDSAAAEANWRQAQQDLNAAKEAYQKFYVYIPDGDNNAFVDITYTMTSPSGKVIATMNIPHGTALSGEFDNTGNIHWTFADGDGATIQEDGEYKISATVTPVKTTRAESHTGSSDADATCAAQTYTKTQTAHIYQLQITVKDTRRKPGATIDFADDTNESVFGAVQDDDWKEVHWVDAKWISIDGHTASDPANEPGKAGMEVGESPLGYVTLGKSSDVTESDGTKYVSKTAADGTVIPARISVTRRVGNLNKNVSTDEQTKNVVANMSDDDHLYGAFSSVVWKHECQIVDDCDSNELTNARNEIDGGKIVGQNITRFLIHVSETPLPNVEKATSTPSILRGQDIDWTVTVSNTNEAENEHHKTTKAQMLDVLPYLNDRRTNPNDNTDTGSSFGGDLYFKTIRVDCASAQDMTALYANGTAKFYYTEDTAVRVASREDWYDGNITWTEVTPSVNGNTVSFTVPQSAVAIKSDTALAWNETLAFHMTANVKNPDDQRVKDTYINAAVIGNDDEAKDSNPVVTTVTTLSIAGNIWNDDNTNGQMDNDERRTDGITVSLYRDMNNASSEALTLDGTRLEKAYNDKEETITPCITDDDGYFEFNNLLPGTYYVVATEISADYKVTAKQAAGTDDALNSKAEEAMPAGQTAWIKKIVVSDKSVKHQNIGLVIQKGTLTIQKAMENGELYYPSSMTDEQKKDLVKGFIFKLTNNATGEIYTSTLHMDMEHTDGVSAVIEDLPLGTYTLKEESSLGYNVKSMAGEEGNFSYNEENKTATVVISAGNAEVRALVVNKIKEPTPGVYPGESVANHIGTSKPINFAVEYAHGDINDTSAVSYTFKESDFANMTVWYDDGSYRDFTGMYKQNANGSVTKLSDDRLKFSEVTLSPATITNEKNTADSGNKVDVKAYYSERSKTLSDKFSVGVNLAPVYKFTVVFHANGSSFGGTDTNAVRFMYNDSKAANDIISGIYKLPDAHDGWTYAGWNTASDGSGVNYDSLTALNELGAAKSGTSRIDLYAHWTTIVSFHANGGVMTGGTSAAEQGLNGQTYGSITVNIGSTAATNLSGSISGRQFVTWNTAANGTGTDISRYGKIYGPVTFYATYMVTDFGYTGGVQSWTAPISGTYRIEAYGAQGGRGNNRGSSTAVGGYGAYVCGDVHLTGGTTLYIYVGGAGSDARCTGGNNNSNIAGGNGGWNGGGHGSNNSDGQGNGGGGGATDIRYGGDLSTRILVAAGGGGTDGHSPKYGGAIAATFGGTLTSSGAGQNYGNALGQGRSYYGDGCDGGGGGGYYGGSFVSKPTGGGGGSSYLSGYPGCTTTGYVFTNGNMIAGQRSGHGYAHFSIIAKD